MARNREMDDFSVGLPKNFVRPCLLLLLSEEPSHGYDLLERLARLGLSAIDPGGLYRALRAMEQEGLLVSKWVPSDVGPARRIYRTTDEGRDWLHAWAGTLRETARTIRRFINRYDALEKTSAGVARS
ncbi:MAG: helix-turn-helix transcriptional regulator [Actinomycetota bacterium]